jgi:hypothetical protein
MLRCTNGDGKAQPAEARVACCLTKSALHRRIGELFECRQKQFRRMGRLRSMVC